VTGFEHHSPEIMPVAAARMAEGLGQTRRAKMARDIALRPLRDEAQERQFLRGTADGKIEIAIDQGEC
jgi:hypothetical protein